MSRNFFNSIFMQFNLTFMSCILIKGYQGSFPSEMQQKRDAHTHLI